MTTEKIRAAWLAIAGMESIEELHATSKLVTDRMRQIERSTTTMFSHGDEVEFDAGRKGVLRGAVTKVNERTVTVTVQEPALFAGPWKVSATLLRRVGGR